MSATGRGPRLGGPSDFYETPSWCVRDLLTEWQPCPGPLLEPGAGRGNIILTATAVLGTRDWHAVEALATFGESLAATKAKVTIGDFLTTDDPAWRNCVAAIGNPPYSCAEAFVRRCFEVAPLAEVAVLLRLNFLASKKRLPLYAKHGVPDVYVLPRRPSFVGGKTDSCEYGWFVWPPSAVPARVGLLRVIGTKVTDPRETRGGEEVRW